jgi:hypothetical protein
MPFREHLMPPISKHRVVKAAKTGRRPTGIAAVMGEIGKELTSTERAVLRAPVPPPWYLEHVVDPAWVKGHSALAAEVLKAPEAPTTIIGNYEAQVLGDLFDEELLFTLERGGQPGEHHVYKLDGEEHEALRKHLRDFMQRAVEEAGVVLPEDEDERDLSLDKIEAKLVPDLRLLIKGLKDAAISQLGNEEEKLSIEKLCRSVWQNWIVDGAVDNDVQPQECLDFAIDSMGQQEVISYVFEGMLPFDAQAAFADLKRIGVIR